METLGRSRIWLVYAVMGMIVAGSLVDLATGREHWPFSPYPMYAVVPHRHILTALRLFGVVAGSRREIPLVAPEYIYPFTPSRLEGALRELTHRADKGALREALADCLRRYEKRRQAGDHHGPQLQGIRLYRVVWQLDPWARNVGRPDREEPILDITPP